MAPVSLAGTNVAGKRFIVNSWPDATGSRQRLLNKKTNKTKEAALHLILPTNATGGMPSLHIDRSKRLSIYLGAFVSSLRRATLSGDDAAPIHHSVNLSFPVNDVHFRSGETRHDRLDDDKEIKNRSTIR